MRISFISFEQREDSGDEQKVQKVRESKYPIKKLNNAVGFVCAEALQ
jgi:hypothetical protein